jgi:hypothetical protein
MRLLTSLFIVAGFALVVVNCRPVQFMTTFFAPLGSQVRTAIQTVSDLLERRFVQFAGVPYQSPASRQEWEELWEAELDSYGTATRVEAWRGCSDPRVLATSADETGEALLPQLVRTKVTTSATSLSESRQAKRGMVNCAGVRAVRGVRDPSSTMEMSDCGFPACTTGLPASRGNTSSYPTPSGRWQAAQLSR